MKIVMQYELSGGYECGCYEITKCFEYESTEAFLVDFETAIEKTKEEYNNNRKLVEDWRRREPFKLSSNDKNFDKKKAKYESKWEEWAKERPTFDFSTEFTFCSQQFDFNDFLDPYELRIHELNEWFDLRSKGM
jgi:hypothetical protein